MLECALSWCRHNIFICRNASSAFYLPHTACNQYLLGLGSAAQREDSRDLHLQTYTCTHSATLGSPLTRLSYPALPYLRTVSSGGRGAREVRTCLDISGKL